MQPKGSERYDGKRKARRKNGDIVQTPTYFLKRRKEKYTTEEIAELLDTLAITKV